MRGGLIPPRAGGKIAHAARSSQRDAAWLRASRDHSPSSTSAATPQTIAASATLNTYQDHTGRERTWAWMKSTTAPKRSRSMHVADRAAGDGADGDGHQPRLGPAQPDAQRHHDGQRDASQHQMAPVARPAPKPVSRPKVTPWFHTMVRSSTGSSTIGPVCGEVDAVQHPGLAGLVGRQHHQGRDDAERRNARVTLHAQRLSLNSPRWHDQAGFDRVGAAQAQRRMRRLRADFRQHAPAAGAFRARGHARSSRGGSVGVRTDA